MRFLFLKKTIYASCFDSLNNNHDKKNDDEKKVCFMHS